MHIYKIPGLIKWSLPVLVWKINASKKEIYLTFDDGPVPGITDWVLDILRQFEAKATFFVVGENVVRNRGLYQRIIDEGHATGNHTYNHLNAWKSSARKYLENVEKCDKVLNDHRNPPLFRPPHGKLTPALIRSLRKKYSIIMWDVLSGDYRSSISAKECLKETLRHVSRGSIVVFHDSHKSEARIKSILPDFLEELGSRGFSFKRL